MNNIILSRIERQRNRSSLNEQSNSKVIEEKVEKKIEVKCENCAAISLAELKNLLMEEIDSANSEKKIEVVEDNQPKDRVFGGIIDFVDWFTPNKEKFTEKQLIPLNTLVQARQMIEIGCGCKRAQRLNQSDEYFKVFWMNNKNTDLPETVMRIGNFKTLKFSNNREIEFLKFSTPENPVIT